MQSLKECENGLASNIVSDGAYRLFLLLQVVTKVQNKIKSYCVLVFLARVHNTTSVGLSVLMSISKY